ncbi:hypothetical protein [Halorubrum sp. 2020YC2]|uniref:hypothetical protein n=1 Tax=Halorubrum sp. 2020YC2 TaxID=2836432 RepID=UPI00203738A8|nr:hypothetical protein [Halorubrum sp. 2020YC2]
MSVPSAIALRIADAFSNSPGAVSVVVYAVRSAVDRGAIVTETVSFATAVPCSDRSVRLYVPGEIGSVVPLIESTLTPDPVVMKSDGESGEAYVLIVMGVGPVPVVERLTVVVLLDTLFRFRLKYGTL